MIVKFIEWACQPEARACIAKEKWKPYTAKAIGDSIAQPRPASKKTAVLETDMNI